MNEEKVERCPHGWPQKQIDEGSTRCLKCELDVKPKLLFGAEVLDFLRKHPETQLYHDRDEGRYRLRANPHNANAAPELFNPEDEEWVDTEVYLSDLYWGWSPMDGLPLCSKEVAQDLQAADAWEETAEGWAAVQNLARSYLILLQRQTESTS